MGLCSVFEGSYLCIFSCGSRVEVSCTRKVCRCYDYQVMCEEFFWTLILAAGICVREFLEDFFLRGSSKTSGIAVWLVARFLC